jgi:hypothetical protein
MVFRSRRDYAPFPGLLRPESLQFGFDRQNYPERPGPRRILISGALTCVCF